MLYKKAVLPELTQELFTNPTSEYRGTPFWSWNCEITKDLIKSQIEIFKEMGMGGVHIHPRTGLKTPYLGEKYMDYIQYSNEVLKDNDMYCWLYDEDRYPSGAAGGMVTENLNYRSRHLLLTKTKQADMCKDRKEFLELIAGGKKPRGYYLTSYTISLKDGYLDSYSRATQESNQTTQEDLNNEKLWHAYLELAEESPWYNDQTYINALDKEAVKEFIRITHETYFKAVGDDFGKSIPAIFTDEPHVKGKMTHPFADSEEDITLSFTDDMPDTFKETYGTDLLDILPEILWQLPEEKVSAHRYHYHDHMTERFVSAFSDTIGEWCEEHGIALTGHFLSERSLYSQTLALGETMRNYRSFQIPGVDILCDQKELSTLKQAVSVARQYGREGVISELYGVTHWDHDFKGHKLQGDWQAALGITIRCHHLAYMSMEGEAKRDWPASISYQSPWYQKYPYIEDHFARVNTAMVRGKACVNVGVIHPIESFWLYFGPNDQTQAIRDQMDVNYENLMQWLLYGTIDFDLISEALLPELCEKGSVPLEVGEMEYDTILIPDCRTLRSSTLERLEAFVEQGGKIIFAGRVPRLVDAKPSSRAIELAKKANVIGFNREEMLDSLKEERVIEIRKDNGRLSDNLFYQLREDTDGNWLYICHVNRKRNQVDTPEPYRIKIKGKWKIDCYDTLSGKVNDLPTEYEGEDTYLYYTMYSEDSLLLKLTPLRDGITVSHDQKINHTSFERLNQKQIIDFTQPKSFDLSEQNVLLLDYAAYQFNDGPIKPKKEILRLDNEIRKKLGYPLRRDAYTQPWRFPKAGRPKDKVTLFYEFNSKIEVADVMLAMERPENAKITLNDEIVKSEASGYYVDSFIHTVPLPKLNKGMNKLTLEIPFGRETNLENIYILGDFGVALKGRTAEIVDAPKHLEFGDITRQGLPFYTGNLDYNFTVDLKEERELILSIPHFSSPVLEIFMNGESKGLMAFAPHMKNIGKYGQGKHELKVRLFGNRFNGFGTLHNCDDEFMWYGPDSYRTVGSQWSDSYGVRPVGILSRVELIEQEND